MPTVIPKGEKAPLFTLENQENKSIPLDSFLGKWVVLYFYPKDNTPGCTTEAIDFTQLKGEFEKHNATILGVSPDSVASHCKFIAKKELTIQLLADPEHATIENYGAWQLKKFMGREFMGVVRSTWLINPEGLISEVWSPVKVKEHAKQVLETLKDLQK